MNTQQKKTIKRMRLKTRIRSRVIGTESCPRLSVFRSNLHIYAQLIDDAKGITLAQASDLKIEKGTKAERSVMVGKDIATVAKKAGINTVVFDRNGFKYTGRVKMVADAARDAGLAF
jgi:large subunit ribosomal protein L18